MQAATITELTRDTGWAPLRAHLGARAFGVNAWTKDADEQLVGEHDEQGSGPEELYLVIAGRARFTVDGVEREAGPGTVVLVDPTEKRTAVALEDRTTVVVVGGPQDGAFRPRAWETNAIVFPLFGEGRIEEAREILRDKVGAYEDGESIEYNLACCEARLGDVDRAFDHLRRGLERRPDLIELARGDDDLAALHDDPRFAELVGAVTQPG